MTHREHLFAVLEGKHPANMPFFPDITDWYTFHRTPAGEPRVHEPGAFISDKEPFHTSPGTLPEAYRDFTLFDFYRTFDWGFFVHIYDWYDIDYTDRIERITEIRDNVRTVTYHTPFGDLTARDRLAADGTWSPCEHPVKSMSDLDIMRAVVEATRYSPRYDRVRAVMEELGEHGAGDTVIFTSPFGKLVHDYLGFEQVVYGLADDPVPLHEFLELQEKKDLELINLAAGSPEVPVIISDHPDEYLISPSYYETYLIPFYTRAADILHEAGKLVSTHLDGNCRGFFPLLGKTPFDYLDGITPAPMFNFEVEELAEALPDDMQTFCGVPSTLFCQNRPTEEILSFADRIISSLRGRCILNVGDILPPNGDIGQVIALGEHVRKTWTA